MKYQNKGITLISLIITIILTLILSAVVVTNTYTGSDYKKYRLMCADVALLEDKILMYYQKYGVLPVFEEEVIELPQDIENIGHNFYKINVNRLKGITLNFGDKDFIVDETTLEVYYLDGIEYEDVIYYTD